MKTKLTIITIILLSILFVAKRFIDKSYAKILTEKQIEISKILDNMENLTSNLFQELSVFNNITDIMNTNIDTTISKAEQLQKIDEELLDIQIKLEDTRLLELSEDEKLTKKIDDFIEKQADQYSIIDIQEKQKKHDIALYGYEIETEIDNLFKSREWNDKYLNRMHSIIEKYPDSYLAMNAADSLFLFYRHSNLDLDSIIEYYEKFKKFKRKDAISYEEHGSTILDMMQADLIKRLIDSNRISEAKYIFEEFKNNVTIYKGTEEHIKKYISEIEEKIQ